MMWSGLHQDSQPPHMGSKVECMLPGACTQLLTPRGVKSHALSVSPPPQNLVFHFRSGMIPGSFLVIVAHFLPRKLILIRFALLFRGRRR